MTRTSSVCSPDVLTDEGYEVTTATQSLRAFDRAKESQPDLILMDIMMPYLDGLDQIKLLSLEDDLKDIPSSSSRPRPDALDGIDDLRALRIVDHLCQAVRDLRPAGEDPGQRPAIARRRGRAILVVVSRQTANARP